MAPKKGASKKKSPSKKALPVAVDGSGVYFGAAGTAEEEEVPADDDPLASYRAAAAAAAKAVEKERKEAAQTALFEKIFVTMDWNSDGVVDMQDVVEKVTAGTAQLSARASAPQSRPEGAVALQLPATFTRDVWLKEMQRMASLMDEETFEANVLGLFRCFEPASPRMMDALEERFQKLKATSTSAEAAPAPAES
jgi:hypothetical protein